MTEESAVEALAESPIPISNVEPASSREVMTEEVAENPIPISDVEQKICYDIFLSFRGEDTRHTFTGHLYNALCKRGFKTFMDDDGLERGEEISLGLIKAIEESKISIVIFSENYASSTWCLNELVKILECKRKKGQMVWPIFYKIDPCDVKYQINSYREAMDKHESRFKSDKEKVKTWRLALNEAANLSGWTFKTGYEFRVIKTIIEEVSTKLHRKHLYIAEHIIGLESHLKEVKSLLDIQYGHTTRMLGIHGLGGIGKTTLGKVLYNSIVDQFDFACFLESIRERSNSGIGLLIVQESLLSDIYGKKKFNLGSIDVGANMIKHDLCNRRVLLVLDDVDKMEQLEKLAGGRDWFGPGSKIIITRRNKHLLSAHGIENRYKMNKLDHDKALELFCWNAFKRKQPDESYMNISNRIIDYAKGLPLALKVIGSNLFGRSLTAWESALDNYQRTPAKRIQDVLRVSYDSLEEDQKTIFLDIACFLKGKRLEDAERILDACDLSPKYNIEVLVDKSLITIELQGIRDLKLGIRDLKLGMHDLIQDMGKEIVKQEASSELGRYSRLWNHEDILDVLTTNTGSDRIQIITFRPDVPEKVEWGGMSFEKMKNLRILIIKNAEFSVDPKSLPNSLRVLEWDRYPSQSLPEGFFPRKMVILKLWNSSIISLKPLQKFEKLTYVDFSECELLTRIPDISRAPNITTLGLVGCTNLKEVHDSVGGLTKLIYLSLEGCTNLEIFPHGIRMTSLASLNLNDCRSLQHFPDILEKMDTLERTDAERTGIKEIPHSICYLSGLQILNISHSYDLESLPESINQLDKLRDLYVNNCKKLQQISGIPPNFNRIRADGCISLSSQSLNTLWSQVLQEIKYLYIIMPRASIPDWFTHRRKGGNLSFRVGSKYRGFSVAIVLKDSTNKISPLSNGTSIVALAQIYCSTFNDDGIHTVLHKYCEIEVSNTHDRNHINIQCRSLLANFQIDECGVYLYKQSIKIEDIQFEYPIPNNSNVDRKVSMDDAELKEEILEAIEEEKARKRSYAWYMSRKDEKIHKAKPRKKSCRVMLKNDKEPEADKL